MNLDPNAQPAENVLIFSGSAHPGLTQEIAHSVGLEVSPTVVEKFSNDNLYVHLGVSVRSKEVFIVQPITPPSSDHLMELLFMLDIARSAGAKGVHAVIPYYSYARSDKKDAPRISISGRLVADLLQTAGATHVIAMTLHAPQVHGFFSMPTDHLTAQSVFVEHFIKQDLTNTVVVSPDIGNAKRASMLARSLGLPIAAGEKFRKSDDEVEFGGIMGDVKGKRAIIIDDEIATGGSMVELIRILRKEDVHRVTVVCTHGLFTGKAAERLNSVDEIEEIVTTNTVPIAPHHVPERLTTLSVGHIFGEVIRRNVVGESVGALFEYWKKVGRG
ncbi:MAG TPA: ribose-phosphate pyrophosphokinase [Anaerolineales bacterium]|nr:ribose-phosphate pyrophosphokinase [Anaerolineales bacterium]